MRALIKAICEHALFGTEGRDVPHFNQDRMNKYSGLISEFGESKQAREANCLFGIQQLIHHLEHPQGINNFINNNTTHSVYMQCRCMDFLTCPFIQFCCYFFKFLFFIPFHTA